MGSVLLLALGATFGSLPLPAQQTATSALATAPKGARPKSAAEAQAYNALGKLIGNAATTPDQIDAAITAFVTQYPTSDFLSAVAVFGLRFYQDPKHSDYSKSLLYGEQAIKADPNSLFALITVGDLIPGQVKDTDLDRAQRLDEATQDDQQAITLCTTPGATVSGRPIPSAAKSEAQASAYSSLARIAMLKKDYAGVVANFQKAVPFDDASHQAVDYFYMAQAQISMEKYPDALASLDQAAKADPANAQVQAAVAEARRRIAAIQGH